MSETALMEFFLLVIAVLLTAIGGVLSIIGWVGRKYLMQIVGKIDTLFSRVDNQEECIEKTQDDVREIKTSLTGEENTPWDGFIGETKKNQRFIQENREKIQANRRAIKENVPTIEFNDNGAEEINDEWT